MKNSISSLNPQSRNVFNIICVDYPLSQLGYFITISILAVFLRSINLSPMWTGISLFALSFTTKVSTVFIQKILHSSKVRNVACVGLIFSSFGFGALPFLSFPVFITLSLALGGCGVALNAFAIRILVEVTDTDRKVKKLLYNIIQIFVNFGSAVGPFIANTILVLGGYTQVFMVSGCVYVIIAGIVWRISPNKKMNSGTSGEPLNLPMMLKDLIRNKNIRKLSAITVIGSLCYAQFFSCIAVLINMSSSSALIRSLLFLLNALILIFLQIPITLIAEKFIPESLSNYVTLLCGIGLFCISFLILSIIPINLATLCCSIVFFALGEILFIPNVITAFFENLTERPIVESLNFRQLTTGLGESLGAFLGGSFFSELLEKGHSNYYWLLILTLTTLSVVFCSLPFHRNNT